MLRQTIPCATWFTLSCRLSCNHHPDSFRRGQLNKADAQFVVRPRLVLNRLEQNAGAQSDSSTATTACFSNALAKALRHGKPPPSRQPTGYSTRSSSKILPSSSCLYDQLEIIGDSGWRISCVCERPVR